MANKQDSSERKAGLTSEETAMIGLVALILGGLLAGLDYLSGSYMAAGSGDERILPVGAALLLAIAALAFVNLDRFHKSTADLIAVPSPLCGAIVCVVVAAYEIAKVFHLV